MRMELLAGMFPGAKFIHITRDPMVVVPSTNRMWNIVAAQNKLKKGWTGPSVTEAASVLCSYLDHVAKCREKLEHPVAEVRFEDLEKEISRFMKANSGFEKNIYNLTEEEQELIKSRCQT